MHSSQDANNPTRKRGIMVTNSLVILWSDGTRLKIHFSMKGVAIAKMVQTLRLIWENMHVIVYL